jgi:hypothetical protein
MSFSKVIILIMVIGFSGLSAQTNIDKPKKNDSKSSKETELPKFSLKMNMNKNTFSIYKFTENSKIVRTMSDSSKRRFSRDAEYYFTFKVPNSPDNGFNTYEFSIDSLKYKFTEDGDTYEYNSQSDNPGPVTFEDLKNTVVPLGKEFTLTYSPYGEIVKVEGESLDWLRNYVVVEGKGVLDSLETHLWLDGISKQRLVSICDPKKLIFPANQVYLDSNWNSTMEFQVMNITCFDTSIAKIKSLSNGVFDIVGESTGKISALKEPVRFYGFKDYLVNVIKINGNGNYEMVFGPRGLIRSFKLNYFVKLTGKVKQEVFNDMIDTKQSWEMLNQYKY